MIQPVVIDASAIIALLFREKGWEEVERYFQSPCLISSANYCESLYIFKRKQGQTAWNDISELLENLQMEVVPVSKTHAKIASAIHSETRSKGLSLGDCLCLALGIDECLPIITAEHSWGSLPLTVKTDIRLIR